ncbi:MAG: RNA 2',3'-cyclic phosphodiesterase [Coriobacteriia bacterium]|nr:RNA 2',3'-cyclic phosphodiesterase [Coriobacteriia bacterium]
MREMLTACRAAVVDADPSWAREKWVAPENLHVTVRFLGELADADAQLLQGRLSTAFEDVVAYTLRLDRPAAIPRPRSASMLWMEGSEGAEQTTALAARADSAADGLADPPDSRRFRTHVTLCRARTPRPLAPHTLETLECVARSFDEPARSMSVREVTLYSSVLTRSGPVYTVVERFSLGR